MSESPHAHALRILAKEASYQRALASHLRSQARELSPAAQYHDETAAELERAQDWLAAQLTYPGSTGERCAEIGAYGQCEFASGHAPPHRAGDWQWVSLNNKAKP